MLCVVVYVSDAAFSCQEYWIIHVHVHVCVQLTSTDSREVPLHVINQAHRNWLGRTITLWVGYT